MCAVNAAVESVRSERGCGNVSSEHNCETWNASFPTDPVRIFAPPVRGAAVQSHLALLAPTESVLPAQTDTCVPRGTPSSVGHEGGKHCHVIFK